MTAYCQRDRVGFEQRRHGGRSPHRDSRLAFPDASVPKVRAVHPPEAQSSRGRAIIRRRQPEKFLVRGRLAGRAACRREIGSLSCPRPPMSKPEHDLVVSVRLTPVVRLGRGAFSATCLMTGRLAVRISLIRLPGSERAHSPTPPSSDTSLRSLGDTLAPVPSQSKRDRGDAGGLPRPGSGSTTRPAKAWKTRTIAGQRARI